MSKLLFCAVAMGTFLWSHIAIAAPQDFSLECEFTRLVSLAQLETTDKTFEGNIVPHGKVSRTYLIKRSEKKAFEFVGGEGLVPITASVGKGYVSATSHAYGPNNERSSENILVETDGENFRNLRDLKTAVESMKMYDATLSSIFMDEERRLGGYIFGGICIVK